MAAFWMLSLLMLSSVAALPQNKMLEVEPAGTLTLSVSDCQDESKHDEFGADWCMQCNPGAYVRSISRRNGGVKGMFCKDFPIVTETQHSEKCEPSPTDSTPVTYKCPVDYILMGLMYSEPYSDLTEATLKKLNAIRCAKLTNYKYDNNEGCEDVVEDNPQVTIIRCSGEKMLSGISYSIDGIESIWCCAIKEGSPDEATSDVTTATPDAGNASTAIEPADLVKIPMSVCLEVDPFYTDCGASCWSGQLTSNYVIQGIKVNNSAIEEVHCQPQENVTLSLIQVNKFVLELYPLLVCPTNYLVTALWSQSHTNQTLKTIKCNLLYPHQHMTNCELFDTEDGLASCDTANGYYMGGVMLDDHTGITQVMCCHIIEFDLQF